MKTKIQLSITHIFLFALVVLQLTLLSSCTRKRQKYVIAVSQCSEDIWREKLNNEMEMSTYLYDEEVELKIVSADDDDKLQIRQIDQFVTEGVDLLVVAPNQVHTISTVIDKAYDSGIPVILLDRKTDSEKYTAFIGADNVEMGRVLAKFVATALRGKGKVLEIAGLEGSSPAWERHQGFVSAMENYPGIEMVGMKSGDWTQRSGRRLMSGVVEKGTHVDCVYGQNDRMALGAYEAVKSHALKDSILYVGVDALPGKDGGIELVQRGVLAASYIYPTRGDLVMQLAMNILEGKPYERENLLSSTLVTKENADVTMLQAEEMLTLGDRLAKLNKKVDTYLTLNGYQKLLMISLCALIGLGLLFVIFAYRQIVQNRKMEEDATNAKLQFFTNVSHEFRTPLTLIADPVDRMLESGELTDHQRDMMQIAKKNVNVLLRLVGDLLDFRKIQNGKMNMTFLRLNLSEFVKQWTEGFRSRAEKGGVKLSVDSGENIEISGDIYKLERICYNLLSNALKYTPKGGEVALALKRKGENEVEIIVKDNGVGIPKDEIAHVFDRFYQVKKNNAGGTGIGLALVEAFAKMHGGKAEVESEVGKGTTFTVTLPIDQPGFEYTVVEMPEKGESIERNYSSTKSISSLEEVEKTPIEKMTSAEMVEMDGQKPLLLVIDDNDDVRSYVSALLKDEYVVIQSADGKSGLERAVKEVPDLVICDVMMPVMDGLEFCKRLKQEVATSHIPVLMLTARTMEEQRAEGYEYGADAYITKPFNNKVLISRVRNLLENRKRLKSLFGGADADIITQKPTDADAKFIYQFRKLVQQRMGDSELNVEVIAAEMGLSRVQLYRKVKALTDASPVEMIRMSRLNRAKILLSKGDRNVSEVAYEVGFSSPSYFSKCYKEQFGHLPAEEMKNEE